MRIEHTAATGTQHVPGEIEQSEPRGVEKSGNHPLFVKAGARREIERVDPIEFVIFAGFDQSRDRLGHLGVDGLLQHRKLGLSVGHGIVQSMIRKSGNRFFRKDHAQIKR